MNLYVISQEHIQALRDMLDKGIGARGKPISARRRKDLEKQIAKLEQEVNNNNERK